MPDKKIFQFLKKLQKNYVGPLKKLKPYCVYPETKKLLGFDNSAQKNVCEKYLIFKFVKFVVICE